MTNEEAIKYLQQLYPNGGHCWLDKQRIEAIGMAIKVLQKEPVSERFAFKAIPRLLEMIEPTDRAKAYIEKLADALEVEGYLTDAKIVRESLKIMNGEKVAMATMDEEPVSDIDFEQELYKAFGQVKDFTLGMQIAKRFYEMGKQHQEPVSKDVEEASRNYADNEEYGEDVYFAIKAAFKAGAKWQKEQIKELLLSEVLPYFMNGGEADEVVAKLEEVLSQNK